MFPESMKKLDRGVAKPAEKKVVTEYENGSAYFDYADKVTGEPVRQMFNLVDTNKAKKDSEKSKKLVMEFHSKRKGMSDAEFSSMFDVKVAGEKKKKIKPIDWIIFVIEFITLLGGLTLLGMNVFPNMPAIAVLGIAFGIATIINICIYLGSSKGISGLTKFAVSSVFVIVFLGIACSVQKIMQIFAPNFTFFAALVMLLVVFIVAATVYALIKTHNLTKKKEGH